MSHVAFCFKRSKLELFTKVRWEGGGNGSIRRGNRMHYLYSYPLKSFDRQLILSKLPKVLERQIDNILVRGRFDDLRVLLDLKTREKLVSLVEVKTTFKRYMWNVEVQSAIFQLQLYLWLIRPILESLGWKMHKRHYLEIYSQHTGRLMKRVVVEEDPNIEDRIRFIIRAFQGLEKVQFPHRSTCKLCSKTIKENCDWHANM